MFSNRVNGDCDGFNRGGVGVLKYPTPKRDPKKAFAVDGLPMFLVSNTVQMRVELFNPHSVRFFAGDLSK